MATTDEAVPPTVLRPWRSLAICAGLVFLVVMVLRDIGLFSALTEMPSAPEADAEDSLITRIVKDPVRLVFASCCTAVVVFIAIQVVMLTIDLRTLHRGEYTGARALPSQFFRLLAARPLHFGRPKERHTDAFVAGVESDILADPLRLGLSAFPMLGFIGTVVGLSGAIKALPRAIGNPDKLAPVLAELHVAFDTTLLGLVGAFSCLIGVRLIEQVANTLARHVGTG